MQDFYLFYAIILATLWYYCVCLSKYSEYIFAPRDKDL